MIRMKGSKLSEEQQRDLFLQAYHEENTLMFCEVPVFNRSIDVVKFNPVTGEITAIEFKLNDWKRVIRQVLTVGISFDYLEICIPKPKLEQTSNLIISACRDEGIGLYFWDMESLEFVKIIEPVKSLKIWGIQKSLIIQYVGRLAS